MTRLRTVAIGPEPMWRDDVPRITPAVPASISAEHHEHQWERRPIISKMPASLARIPNEHVRSSRFVCFGCGEIRGAIGAEESREVTNRGSEFCLYCAPPNP